MAMGRVSRGIGSVCALVLVFGVCSCVSEQALGFPEGRVYELVSPVYKGGYGVVGILAVAQNGESVAFSTLQSFGGGYLASRGASDWSTVSLAPPAAMEPYYSDGDFSPTLGSSLTLNRTGANHGFAQYQGTERVFLLHRTDTPDTEANFEVAGMVLGTVNKRPTSTLYEGASPDFCHILFDAGEAPFLLEALGAQGEHLYELDSGCGGGEPSLRLVDVNNQGKMINPHCTVSPGIDQSYAGGPNKFNSIAAGGSEVFFTTNVESGAQPSCRNGVHQLFVRVGGATTLEVSKPMSEAAECGKEVPCKGAVGRGSANFQGANEAGTEVFFTTAQSLLGEDKDKGNDLYMARIGCPGEEECEPAQKAVTSLVQVSHDSHASGEAAEVQGVVRVAPDGSRVYFVARAVLSEGLNAEGHVPVKGAENLYVYDMTSGKSTFMVDLCSGPGLSGEVNDPHCPTNLDDATGGRNDMALADGRGAAQTAGVDGRFLVFSSYAQLLAGDTGTAADVYRYDAESGVLDRVSLGEAGYDDNGNNSAFDAHIEHGNSGGKVSWQYEMDNRAISEDGSRIVFTTTEPLSPRATNGVEDVYEWHMDTGNSEGSVSLISSGSAEEPDKQVVISPSGRDIFFVTAAGVVPQDIDDAPDIYDARLGGGFAPVPAEAQPCSGDACQGPLTNPAPLLVPGSVSQEPSGNFAVPVVAKPKAKPKPKAKRKKKKSLKKRGKAKKSSMRRKR